MSDKLRQVQRADFCHFKGFGRGLGRWEKGWEVIPTPRGIKG